ncbi:sensor histidine kinase [Segetibacter sp. 3557_3]|uniref:sensor histidine kinase n=1 Tax=Segetibacter sp. 3557_3 TaxID=2547429 RepID=UPI0010587BB5|nr:histidine kinase [Segetibacter sp. 3557_3]TDH20665.1 sensor histidine kinase [Segetibacter sp. 3557_3]
MTDLIKKPTNFNRIEFWGAATIFVFIIFFFVTEGIGNIVKDTAPNMFLFELAGVPFDGYSNYFVPLLIKYTTLFTAFVLLNFLLIPRLLKREAMIKNTLLVILVFISAFLIFGAADTWLDGHLFPQYASPVLAQNVIFQKSLLYTCWLSAVFFFYSLIKYAGIYLLYNSELIRTRYPFVTREIIVSVIVWMITMFLLVVGDADKEIALAWGCIIPSGIIWFSFAFYYLIPRSVNKKRSFLLYIGKTFLILLVTYLPVALLIMLIVQDDDDAFSFSLFNALFQLFITAPLSWVLYKQHLKGNEEVYVLKKELGKSNASFDFLRSQINPHFLFNALNTIYGTAIQEKAERTSEGIEKLGDMMRFMLQENMQDKISLAREVEYLNNYISLQRLRTDTSPGINIETNIHASVMPVEIAPMLLIPFVENAFKHGISFREPSHIKVNLEVKDGGLYFDVYNTKHVKVQNDPEKDKSGIGLTNVKQRLQLLYPRKHELIIRETSNQFFVHLTLQLT